MQKQAIIQRLMADIRGNLSYLRLKKRIGLSAVKTSEANHRFLSQNDAPLINVTF